jgi:hypothetical protein
VTLRAHCKNSQQKKAKLCQASCPETNEMSERVYLRMQEVPRKSLFFEVAIRQIPLQNSAKTCQASFLIGLFLYPRSRLIAVQINSFFRLGVYDIGPSFVVHCSFGCILVLSTLSPIGFVLHR